jgi:hypothetical protein
MFPECVEGGQLHSIRAMQRHLRQEQPRRPEEVDSWSKGVDSWLEGVNTWLEGPAVL